jgi:fatty-acyl-CoA synthase
MRGLIQDFPLTLTHVFERAERLFPEKTIVTADGDRRERTSYRQWANGVRRLVGALDSLGLPAFARVATFGWNTRRHLEVYYAAPCSGRVLHTINIRLSEDQIAFIIDHAEDSVIFVDRSLLPVLRPILDDRPSVKTIVVMGDGSDVAMPSDGRFIDYDELVGQHEPVHDLPGLSETDAAILCYTSGTTGNPKGVLYSHRSCYLHGAAISHPDAMAVCEADVILPVVPMFHANMWGLAHAGIAAGSSFVLPGRDLSPPSIARLIEEERVTLSAGVITVMTGVLPELRGRDVSALRMIPCGGSALPRSLSDAYDDELGLPLATGWGMTETSPLASWTHLTTAQQTLPVEEQRDLRVLQGTPLLGIELRLCEPGEVTPLPWDGMTRGEIQVRGAWAASAYYNTDAPGSFTQDGWLRTGDIATLSDEGFIHLVDRTKDLVKSGGEWISSADLENHILAHPDVVEAAVIAVPHPRWVERPLACVVPASGKALVAEDILEWLRPKVAKWWLPDHVVFLDELPRTSVGKTSKKDLRERFAEVATTESTS